MNELGMQALIVDGVMSLDPPGFAHKMSNRFLVGVVDLMVKLPRYPAGVLEVKQRDRPKDEGHKWTLDVTVPQQIYLRRAHDAGMPAGVASFTHERRSGPLLNRLRLVILTYKEAYRRNWVVTAHEHRGIGDGSIGSENWSIEEHLVVWLGRCEREKK